MRTTLFFFAASLVLASGVFGGSTRHARLMMRQASTDPCVSTCITFLQQNCTTSDCLCTSATQANLQACLNCLGSNATLQAEAANLDNAAAAFNAQCQGTATVSAAVSLPSGDSGDDSGDNQTSAPPSNATTSAHAAGPTDAPGQGGDGISITGAAFTLPGSAVRTSAISTAGAAATQASGQSPSDAVLTVKNGRTILLASLSLVLPVLVF